MTYEHTANWRKKNPDRYRAAQRELMRRKRAKAKLAKPQAEPPSPAGPAQPSQEEAPA